jgi:ABC-type multidrug transport system ATPase subunit
MWNSAKQLAADGTTVLLTTRYLDEAGHLIDRIVVIDHGPVTAERDPDELKPRVDGHRLEVIGAAGNGRGPSGTQRERGAAWQLCDLAAVPTEPSRSPGGDKRSLPRRS